MPDIFDYELEKTAEEPPPARPRSALVWILVLLFLGAAAVAVYVVLSRRSAPPARVVSKSVTAPAASQPLGSAPGSLVLPPLGETDALVRELVRRLSSHPKVAAWLATDGLVRRFAIDVSNVADGRTPARQLPMLRPATGFAVVEKPDGPIVDPRSYARYDSLAEAAASLDAAGIAQLYGTLKPRIEEAAHELGDAPFDSTLERTLVQLLRTPIVEDPIRLQPKGAGYAFADPRLESLTAAQKQLLRMGAGNVRQIKSSLRAVALALGIPAERLPPP